MRAVGVDIIEIERIQSIANKYGQRFLQKIYTEKELEYCRFADGTLRFNSLAVRFAAKEAFYKAANQVVGQIIPWHDCEIVNNKNGIPQFSLHPGLRNDLGKSTIHLSLSHSHRYAVAFVIID